MLGISGAELLVLVLASYRLTHLVVYDKIASFMRRPFMKPETLPEESGFRRFMAQLLSCYWCAGVWISALVVLLRLFAPFRPVLVVLLLLAVAGGQTFLESFVQRNQST